MRGSVVKRNKRNGLRCRLESLQCRLSGTTTGPCRGKFRQGASFLPVAEFSDATRGGDALGLQLHGVGTHPAPPLLRSLRAPIGTSTLFVTRVRTLQAYVRRCVRYIERGTCQARDLSPVYK